MYPSIIRHTCPPAANLPVAPLLQRIYAARDLHSAAELQRELSALAAPGALLHIAAAVALLHTALHERWRIMVIADFDADGASSCALAVRVLRAFGAAWVGYQVPNRFLHSYGLTPELVALAAEERPDLLITVDNGISSHAGVDAAHALGMKVIITDHHAPGIDLPAAEVVVNPNQHGDTFPSKNIAGVGVIFYVLMALRTKLREVGWFSAHGVVEPNLAQFLDLVALGTVADVVRLDHLNRILVEQGLQRIRRGQCVPGISALCALANLNQANLRSGDIGFYIGPCINAAGRLEDMRQGIECLLADDKDTAHRLAYGLRKINRQRGALTADMEMQALARVEQLRGKVAQLPFGLCLLDDAWHQGVVGIIAGRLKEQLHRPVIVFASTGNGQIKGSGRSVAGMHLRDVLAAIDAQRPGLIHHFGGHAMAAGLTIAQADFRDFQRHFDAETRRWLRHDDLHGRLFSDGELALEEFSLEIAALLQQAGPWGQGFPEPLFDGIFEVRSHQVMQNKHLKLLLSPLGGHATLEAVAFNKAKDFVPGTTRVHIAYHLDTNHWRDSVRLQLRIAHFEAAPAETPS